MPRQKNRHLRRKTTATLLTVMGIAIILDRAVFHDIGANVYNSIIVVNIGIAALVIGILLFKNNRDRGY